MNLKEKRKRQQEEQKEKRKKEVIVAAVEVFKIKGIDNAKMTDVAEKAEVGVASVYRYFKTKADLAIECATWIWENEISVLYDQFYKDDFLKLNGLEKVRRMLSSFIEIYQNYPQHLSFLEQFDNFIVRENVSLEKLKHYEQSIIEVREIVFKAIEEGQKDGSIKDKVEKNKFYITITHTLMSLCQKLVIRGKILTSDEEVQPVEQIEQVLNMAVEYLSSK